jgi:AcrR family transcriptional regulator
MGSAEPGATDTQHVEELDTRNLPVRDPAPHLSATAQRILDATRTILDRDGFDALTFEAIARESGENRASIRYHFGSKAGLIAALIDTVMYDGSVQLIRAVMESPTAGERRRALIDVHRQIALHRDDYRTFYDLVPRILRDPDLREHFKQLFVWYRDMDSWALAGADDQETRDTFRPLATLTTAMLDGLALQIQADPDFDIGPAFELWQSLVQAHVERLSRE